MRTPSFHLQQISRSEEFHFGDSKNVVSCYTVPRGCFLITTHLAPAYPLANCLPPCGPHLALWPSCDPQLPPPDPYLASYLALWQIWASCSHLAPCLASLPLSILSFSPSICPHLVPPCPHLPPVWLK